MHMHSSVRFSIMASQVPQASAAKRLDFATRKAPQTQAEARPAGFLLTSSVHCKLLQQRVASDETCVGYSLQHHVAFGGSLYYGTKIHENGSRTLLATSTASPFNFVPSYAKTASCPSVNELSKRGFLRHVGMSALMRLGGERNTTHHPYTSSCIHLIPDRSCIDNFEAQTVSNKGESFGHLWIRLPQGVKERLHSVAFALCSKAKC